MPTMGISIAVPEPYGEDLRRHRAEFGDKAAETVPTHVTLAPPFVLADDGADNLGDSLQTLAAEHQSFTMSLRGTGTFRPVSPVVFVAISEGISQVELLAADVRALLGNGAMTFAFHPHITVAHHLDEPGLDRAFDKLAHYEASFTVNSFVLYRHEDETGWVPDEEFALA